MQVEIGNVCHTSENEENHNEEFANFKKNFLEEFNDSKSSFFHEVKTLKTAEGHT